MKNMNRKEGKKIAVMAAIIMGFMVIAFLPAASATVNSFTVTPSTGLAGAVDSYNALVTTDGVTTLNITIPAGFIGVEPMSGGVELVRIDFWNSSTKAYYGYATFTANDTNPTTKIDAYCELGGATARTTQDVDYTPGATNTFETGFGGDTSSVRTTLPTETVKGSINVTINCTAFYLDDVMFAIGQFVRNPTTAKDYVFTADGVDETVTITAAGGRAIVFRGGWWYLDTTGDHICDELFSYGRADDTPLTGDVNQDGADDVIVVRGNRWYVNTNHDHTTSNLIFSYGRATDTKLVGDVNQDGKDDVIVVRGNRWYVCTDQNYATSNEVFSYGRATDKKLVGKVVNWDKADTIVVRGNRWFVDTTHDQIANVNFHYGKPTDTPLVGDIG